MIKELECEYKNGKAKAEMFQDLFEAEKQLHHYKFLLEDGVCKKIVINKDSIYGTFEILGKTLSMYIDETDLCAVPSQLLNKGFYEPEELEMVLQILAMLPKNSTFLDVGANLGWYGINVLKNFPEMSVHAFEAVPDTAKRLKDNFELNELSDKINIHNYGLFNENTTKTFYYDVVASGASSMADLRGLATTKVIDVEMKRLDDCNINFENVEFIKCDVEGSEYFVYQGAEETIKKYKPIVFSEMLRKWSAKFGYTPNDIINFFNGGGYDCFVISNNKKLRPCPIVDENTIETNYYFLNREKHKRIIEKYIE